MNSKRLLTQTLQRDHIWRKELPLFLSINDLLMGMGIQTMDSMNKKVFTGYFNIQEKNLG